MFEDYSMKKIFLYVMLVFVVSFVFAVPALAAEDIPEGFQAPPDTIRTGGTLVQVVQGIINWVFVAFLIAAVLFVILAAFQFLTGGGDPQQVAEARQKLIWAAVAVVIATLSRAIPTVVNNIIGIGG